MPLLQELLFDHPAKPQEGLHRHRKSASGDERPASAYAFEREARGPRSLKVAALLSKPSRRLVETPVDYVGFSIDDLFVVGYGLDYNERYRNLRDIVVYGA